MQRINKKSVIIKSTLLLVFLVISSSCYAEPRLRPEPWGRPIIGTQLKNLYLVDTGIYRSEQPERDELNNLKTLGINEILNLREFHSDKNHIIDNDFVLHRVKMNTGNITEQELIDSLRIIKNRKGPILVHCWHGSDRTGVTIAAYRIVFNNWTKSEAIDEMINGGYGYHEKIYPGLIELIENLNINNIKKSLN